jgi:acyl-CoA thioesterase-1
MRFESVVLCSAFLAACAGGGSAGEIPAKDTAARAGTADPAPQAATGAVPADRGDTSRAAAGARPRVLVVGTSLTAGLGLDPSDAYPAVLQRMADSAGYSVEIVNQGLSGETSAGALRRIDWLLSEPAAVVIVETGANDGLRGLNVDSTARNIRDLFARIKARQPDARLMLVQMEAPPNLGERYTRSFHDMFAREAKAAGATLIPFLLEGVAGEARYNQADGIHPTAEGARRVAANIWTSLEPELERLDRTHASG